jgi:hypothetical protein
MSFGKRQPIGFCGVERRREVREQTNAAAQIVLPAGQTVQCRVNDFSNASARLAVASAFGLPNMFEFRAAGRTYQVEVMRRGIGHVSVRFI